MSEVHAFIEAEKTTFGVALLCRVLLLDLRLAVRRARAHLTA